MPQDKYGNYCERGYLKSVGIGLGVVIAFVAILSVPGWISAAVWGWTWFFRGVVIFWFSVAVLAVIGEILSSIGRDSAIWRDDF